MTVKERKALKAEIFRLRLANAKLRKGVKQPAVAYPATPKRKPDPVKAARVAEFVSKLGGWRERARNNALLADAWRACGVVYTPAQWKLSQQHLPEVRLDRPTLSGAEQGWLAVSRTLA